MEKQKSIKTMISVLSVAITVFAYGPSFAEQASDFSELAPAPEMMQTLPLEEVEAEVIYTVPEKNDEEYAFTFTEEEAQLIPLEPEFYGPVFQHNADIEKIAIDEAGIEEFADAGDQLTMDELSEIRGAFSPNTANLNILEGIAAHNNVLNSVTGENVISEGSFDGTSGMVNVIQNSGNNTVIQSATIVNLTFE